MVETPRYKHEHSAAFAPLSTQHSIDQSTPNQSVALRVLALMLIRATSFTVKVTSSALCARQVGTPHKAPWHPGTAGHRLIAEVLAMNYLQVFMQAIQQLDDARPGVTLVQLQVSKQPVRMLCNVSAGSSVKGCYCLQM